MNIRIFKILTNFLSNEAFISLVGCFIKGSKDIYFICYPFYLNQINDALKQTLKNLRKKKRIRYKILKKILTFNETEKINKDNEELSRDAFYITGKLVLMAQDNYYNQLDKKCFETNSNLSSIYQSIFVLTPVTFFAAISITLPAMLDCNATRLFDAEIVTVINNITNQR